MQISRYPKKSRWEKLAERPGGDNSAKERKVKLILQRVKKDGDKALVELTQELDNVHLTAIQVKKGDIISAGTKIQPALKDAIGTAYKNIYKFHCEQIKKKAVKIETMPGVVCWRKPVAIQKVGFYIPGGTAPLFSTVLMLGIPARIAGCRNMILCSPPPVHPAILYAAGLCGITEIFGVGGAQAIGAMAYGTKTIPKSDKICGPGNSYVAIAKQLVNRTGTAIDMQAGPSELLVIANCNANATFVAADLLSQAEHGADSQVILLTDSSEIIDKVMHELEVQLPELPRRKMASEALKRSRAIVFKTVDECLAFSNLYAPEHLIISCGNEKEVAENVMNAGSVFLGSYSPESAGDYASGTNHTLPTAGFAKFQSGLSVDSFVKQITFQKISRKGLLNLADTIETMAEAEQLIGHRNAVRVRVKK